eukprot:COSAG01_NODE_75232_length_197_cov_149.663265_1_plen_30_part_01
MTTVDFGAETKTIVLRLVGNKTNVTSWLAK